MQTSEHVYEVLSACHLCSLLYCSMFLRVHPSFLPFYVDKGTLLKGYLDRSQVSFNQHLDHATKLVVVLSIQMIKSTPYFLCCHPGRSIVAKKGDGSQVKESTDSSNTTIEDEDAKGKFRTLLILLPNLFCTFLLRSAYCRCVCACVPS